MNIKDVQNLNALLEKNTPPVLVKMLETLVALLRNRNNACNIDVEIYFKDFKKLKFKMTTIDPAPIADKSKVMTRAHVEKHETNLKALKDGIETDHKKFAYILHWALAFCDYAKSKIS